MVLSSGSDNQGCALGMWPLSCGYPFPVPRVGSFLPRSTSEADMGHPRVFSCPPGTLGMASESMPCSPPLLWYFIGIVILEGHGSCFNVELQDSSRQQVP